MSKLHGNHNGTGQRREPLRPSVAAALPPAEFVAVRGVSPISAHAKEIMGQLIPIRQGYRPDAIAEEAFDLAKAFADQESKLGGAGAEEAGRRKDAASEASGAPGAAPQGDKQDL